MEKKLSNFKGFRNKIIFTCKFNTNNQDVVNVIGTNVISF